MDERDLQAEEALVRLGVDQLRAFLAQLVERGANVVHLVRDVMHSGAALREEAADGRVLAARGDELEPARTDEHRGRLDALIGDERPVLDLSTEEPCVRVDRFVEVEDGDAEMMNAARVHAADATRAGASRRAA